MPLVVDEHRHDVGHLFGELVFALAERDLVADLVEIALGLRAFAVQAADGEVDFLQAAEDLVDLPRDHQGRQVEHHAHAQAGADVRGAGGEVAEAVVVGVGDAGFDQVVELVDLLPGRAEIEAALEDLDPQVVLFVDHHAHLLALVDDHGAGALGIGVLAADELALDQKLAVDGFERADVDVNHLAGELALLVQLLDARAEDFADLGAVGVGRTGDEREIGQIAGQANAAADDDIGLGARAAQPFAAGLASSCRLRLEKSIR